MGIGIHGKKTNNYITNPKKSTIYTPEYISNFIYRILRRNYEFKYILDLCCGNFDLTKPFLKDDIEIIGIDIKKPNFQHDKIDFHNQDCLDDYVCHYYTTSYISFLSEIIFCQPPFNWQSKEEKAYYKDIRKKYNSNLLPEIFLKKIFDDFDKDIPLVLFVPFGFLYNNRINSSRYKFIKSIENHLSSILYLPVDAYKDSGVMTHSCVTFWNLPRLKPFYFIGENNE